MSDFPVQTLVLADWERGLSLKNDQIITSRIYTMATRNFPAFLDAHGVELVTVCSMRPKPALLAKKTWHAVRRLLTPYINTPSTCPNAFKPLSQVLVDWDAQYTIAATREVDPIDELPVMMTRVKRAPKRSFADVDSGSEVSPRKIARPTSIKVEAEHSSAQLADERARCGELRGQNAALTSEIFDLKKELKRVEAMSKKSDEKVVIAHCEQQHTTNLAVNLGVELKTASTSLALAEEVNFQFQLSIYADETVQGMRALQVEKNEVKSSDFPNNFISFTI